MQNPKNLTVITSILCLGMAGCATYESGDPVAEETATCPVIESSDWAASIAPVPGNSSRSILSVTGKVTMPTPGYTFAWDQGALDRSAVPSFELKLSARAPDGMVSQVLDTREVSYSGPAAAQRYRAITVTCEGTVLGRIENVS